MFPITFLGCFLGGSSVPRLLVCECFFSGLKCIQNRLGFNISIGIILNNLACSSGFFSVYFLCLLRLAFKFIIL